jgi:hypothetical protein
MKEYNEEEIVSEIRKGLNFTEEDYNIKKGDLCFKFTLSELIEAAIPFISCGYINTGDVIKYLNKLLTFSNSNEYKDYIKSLFNIQISKDRLEK